MVVQTAQAAIDNANDTTRCDAGYCLRYVRTWLGIPSATPDAQAAWDTAIGKHPGDKSPPDGAPVFWKSSASGSGHGHIALTRHSDMRTTDKSSATYVNNDDGSWPRQAWGQSYLGWAEGFNGVRIPYLDGGNPDDWRASGAVYVEKLHRGQTDSDSVSRLRYRLEHHAHMPDGQKPGYGAGYGADTAAAVKYWQNNLDGQRDTVAPEHKTGDHMTNGQANRLFGEHYEVIEK